MKVGFRFKGKYIGIDPNDPASRVYADRDALGAWEEAELTLHDNGTFDVLFLASNRQLAITVEGKLESRPAGTFGEFEQFFATNQPEGNSLLYRFHHGHTFIGGLLIEAVQ